jgi:hypothetical protein
MRKTLPRISLALILVLAWKDLFGTLPSAYTCDCFVTVLSQVIVSILKK